MVNVAVLVPTLGRPHSLEPLLKNVAETTPAGKYEVEFIADLEDSDTRDELVRLGARSVLHDGSYPVKVNAGFCATWQELVLVANDDVVFHPGWYEAMAGAFEDGAQVVGGPDLSPVTEGGSNVTMPIVSRFYVHDPGAVYGETGTVLHEGYHHNWSETELWQLACHRGVARFVEGCVIEHRHPSWGKGEMDDTYRRGAFAGNEPADRALFDQRRSAWQE